MRKAEKSKVRSVELKGEGRTEENVLTKGTRLFILAE